MSMTPLTGPAPLARRELRRQEMTDFGANIPWLNDPELIPEFATTMHQHPMPGIEDSRHYSLSQWMLDRFVAWSADVHSGLDFGTVFEKHQLSNPERVEVRSSIRDMALTSYGPGIQATSEIHRAVPALAVREGLDDPKDWSKIASQARLFGGAIARDGSNTTALIREYLVGGYEKGHDPNLYNPAKLKLDEQTGITTVTSLDEIIKVAKDLQARSDIFQEGHSGTCVALQVSMFDLFWDAYGFAAAKYIYPHEQPGPADSIPAPEAPDPNLSAALSKGLLNQMRMP